MGVGVVASQAACAENTRGVGLGVGVVASQAAYAGNTTEVGLGVGVVASQAAYARSTPLKRSTGHPRRPPIFYHFGGPLKTQEKSAPECDFRAYLDLWSPKGYFEGILEVPFEGSSGGVPGGQNT